VFQLAINYYGIASASDVGDDEIRRIGEPEEYTAHALEDDMATRSCESIMTRRMSEVFRTKGSQFLSLSLSLPPDVQAWRLFTRSRVSHRGLVPLAVDSDEAVSPSRNELAR
jgi:hypothetical protein